MTYTVRDALRAIQQDGWLHKRTKGSHRQFKHPTKPGTVTIAGKPSQDLPPWLWQRIMKQAGLTREGESWNTPC